VVYSDLWPGIDLVYEGDSGRLKGTFVVRPGADPSRIQLAYSTGLSGAKTVSLTKEGRIAVETPVGGFEEDAPVSYQEIAGKRVYTTPQKLDRGLRWIVACRKPEEGRRDENKKDT